MLLLLIFLLLLVSPSYGARRRYFGYGGMRWGLPLGMYGMYRMNRRPHGMPRPMMGPHRGFRGPRF